MSDHLANKIHVFPRSSRHHSGLTKSFSAWAAFLFGIHCISLSSSGLIPYSWVASVWPGASILGVLTIAMVFCCFHGLTYAVIGSTVPRTGSDYVFSSRVLPPALSFIASWTLVLFSGVVAGGLAAWVPKSAIPALVRPMGVISGDPRLAAVAEFAAGPLGTLLIGGTIILIVLASILRGNAALERILSVGFVFGLIAWVIILYSLASADGPTAFRDAWNTFMAAQGPSGDFDSRIAIARAAGMQTDNSPFAMTLAGLIMGFWIYYGYYIPTFFSEEVRDPTKSLFISTVGSLVVAYLIFAAGAMLLQRLVPAEWIAAEGYIFNNPDAVTATHGAPVDAMPWITFYAAILQPRPLLIYLVAFGWIFTLINLVQTYFFYSSRIIYSWTLDRVVPDWILGGDPLEPRPTRSLIVIAALAFVGLADAAYGGPLGTQLTFVFFAVVTGLVPVFALTFLPRLNPVMFRQVPARLQQRVLGVPLSSWIGGITFLYLAWMIVASFLYPAVGIAKPAKTLGLLAGFVTSGAVVFYAMRAYRKSREEIEVLDTYRYVSSELHDEKAAFDEDFDADLSRV